MSTPSSREHDQLQLQYDIRTDQVEVTEREENNLQQRIADERINKGSTTYSAAMITMWQDMLHKVEQIRDQEKGDIVTITQKQKKLSNHNIMQKFSVASNNDIDRLYEGEQSSEEEDEQETDEEEENEDEEQEPQSIDNGPLSESQRIDNALAAYYANLEQTYYDDADDESNKYGHFLKWFEDNGFDDDCIEEELGTAADYMDCTLTEFDDDFPFANNEDNHWSDEQQQLEIFKILQHCYKHGFDIRIQYGFDPLSDLTVTSLFMRKYMNGEREKGIQFNLSSRDLEETRTVYNKQCDVVFGPKLETSNAFEYALAVGFINDRFPFMQYLVDICMRQRLQYVLGDIYNRNLSDVRVGELLAPHLKHLDKNQASSILDSIDLYLRVCPMMFVTTNLTVINDDLLQIIHYLIIAHDIMQQMLENTDNDIVPFQFDFAIACNSLHCMETICNALHDDDDDDDDSEDEDVGIYGAAHNMNINEDVIGDIQHKLDENQLKSVNVTLSAIRRPQNMEIMKEMDELNMQRIVDVCARVYGIERHEIYEGTQTFACVLDNDNNDYKKLCNAVCRLRVRLVQKVLDVVYKELNVSNVLLFYIVDFEMECSDIHPFICDVLDRNNNETDHFEENKQSIMDCFKQFVSLSKSENKSFPLKQRINMFVDRRSNDYENKNKHKYCDNVIFYECPQGSNRLPDDDMVAESFFNLSQKCMIPKVNYKDGENEAMHTMTMSPIERSRSSTISCRSSRSGNMLVFSFHVVSRDIIKCYLFRDVQYTRFLPQDIKHILPNLFNLKYNKNEEIMNDENSIYDMVSKLSYSDKLLDCWCNNRTK